ncbi:MAG: hypothetical protein QUS08_04575 [Methanothrix sp.]|nr:hypothetical protein [Methanothrix sp.]
MNNKAFAVFVGAIMVLSAFAGFVLTGGDQQGAVVGSGSASLDAFGVQGRLVDWRFDSLEDVLEMAPESTVMAYWINLSASENLTEAARAALPQSLGLTYGSQLYPTRIERLAQAYFNETWIEFHWIRPFPVGYSGLVVPYEGYMMIPASTEYMTVMGRPTIFGRQEAVQQVLDVISGGLPTDRFTLPIGESADLQVASLGRGAEGLVLPGGYREFYLGVSRSGEAYSISARYLEPDASALERAQRAAERYGLTYSPGGSNAEISGSVGSEDLQGLLVALLGP